MSNSKKLSYEMEEPAFLRRMRAAAGGGGRQERYIAPRNRKVHVDDQEDEPTYVLEGGHETISRKEFEALEKGEEANTNTHDDIASVSDTGNEQQKEASKDNKDEVEKSNISVAEVGAKRKRKAARIVAVDDDELDIPEKSLETPKEKAKLGGKAKRRVKLSFNEDE
ncbi:hypothetical protein EDC01DRAFT_638055 [Geopyxis carbonaria]|nr:hypothetical protein EDC01DRAFT_638055 [Geopyxis carbonaria]